MIKSKSLTNQVSTQKTLLDLKKCPTKFWKLQMRKRKEKRKIKVLAQEQPIGCSFSSFRAVLRLNLGYFLILKNCEICTNSLAISKKLSLKFYANQRSHEGDMSYTKWTNAGDNYSKSNSRPALLEPI